MTAFGKRSHDASTAGRHQLGRSFLFLCRVCELPFKPDSDVEPLGPDLHPQVVSIGLFEPAELTILTEIICDVDEAELKARIADLLWITRKQSGATYTMAHDAVRSYIKSAGQFVDGPTQYRDHHAADRLERALRLALRLGRNNKVLAEVISAIEGLLTKRRGEPAFAIAHMVENLLMLGSGNVPMYATYCEEMAGAAEKNAMWHLARGFWELAAKWYRRGDDPMAQNEPMRRAAETYFQESVDALYFTFPALIHFQTFET